MLETMYTFVLQHISSPGDTAQALALIPTLVCYRLALWWARIRFSNQR